ncbi:hypothetical protein ElyMa_005864900 [Elysia marginata]|uniref:Uncharacterized protein n=1 Tax=Elysia marginata TaxID=1093978 RepID=A0AAV4G3F8_9GAST|nr:hypothetical protein ElyMa_005864900 [Elysia marginata]
MQPLCFDLQSDVYTKKQEIARGLCPEELWYLCLNRDVLDTRPSSPNVNKLAHKYHFDLSLPILGVPPLLLCPRIRSDYPNNHDGDDESDDYDD